MIKVGITGGIGAGKSLVAQIFETLRYPLYTADKEAKRLMEQSSAIRSGLVKILGKEAFCGETLDKPFIARKIFGNQELLHKVNALVHPEVRKDFAEWAARYPQKTILFFESAILFDAGFQSNLDAVICVTAPVDVRIKRVMERDTCTYEDVEKRIKAQLKEDEMKKMSDFIITNDGKVPLIPQINTVLSKLKH